ncbi:MAG: hypothetical protein NT070_08455 [Cyanobacteria bacterium]|nr:hypothetical protein [Cyanobacteriota bacterium]
MNWLRNGSLERIAADLNDAYERERNATEDVDLNEDLLSYKLVRTIRDVLTRPPDPHEEIDPENGFSLAVQAYKATGRLEQTHGDIAIVVTDVDHHVTGCGFYEAKAEFHNGTYPSYKMRQIRRLESKTPRLAVVIYERDSKPVNDNLFDDSLPYWGGYKPLNNNHQTLSHCRVLPATWVRQFSRLDTATALMPPCSFGHHFVTRYLLGRDLDFSRPPTETIDRWVRLTKRAPPIVLEIFISRNPDTIYENKPTLLLPGSTLMSLDFIEKERPPHELPVSRSI